MNTGAAFIFATGLFVSLEAFATAPAVIQIHKELPLQSVYRKPSEQETMFFDSSVNDGTLFVKTEADSLVQVKRDGTVKELDGHQKQKALDQKLRHDTPSWLGGKGPELAKRVGATLCKAHRLAGDTVDCEKPFPVLDTHCSGCDPELEEVGVLCETQPLAAFIRERADRNEWLVVDTSDSDVEVLRGSQPFRVTMSVRFSRSCDELVFLGRNNGIARVNISSGKMRTVRAEEEPEPLNVRKAAGCDDSQVRSLLSAHGEMAAFGACTAIRFFDARNGSEWKGPDVEELNYFGQGEVAFSADSRVVAVLVNGSVAIGELRPLPRGHGSTQPRSPALVPGQ